MNTFLNQGRKVNTYSIQDNATWLKGKHEISFGFQSAVTARGAVTTTPASCPPTRWASAAPIPTGLTAADLPGIRSTDLTTANNLYANLAGIVSSAAQTFNVTSTTSGFRPGRHQPAPVDAQHLGRLCAGQVEGAAEPHRELRRALRVLDAAGREELAVSWRRGCRTTTPRRRCWIRTRCWTSSASPSGRPFYKADKNNFAPNVGFAWDPFKRRQNIDPRRLHDRLCERQRGDHRPQQRDHQQRSELRATRSPTWWRCLSNPPTVAAPAYKVPRTLADNYAITTTSATGMPDPNLATPYVQQWNFGIQHELKGTIVSARYIGNRGTDLLRAIDYNQILYNANGFLADFQRAQNNAGARGKGRASATSAPTTPTSRAACR